MAESPEVVEALVGTGWQVAISQNPHTGLWHWITWKGAGSFSDPAFVAAYNAGLNQVAESKASAIEAAVAHALDRHAGWVEVPIEGYEDA